MRRIRWIGFPAFGLLVVGVHSGAAPDESGGSGGGPRRMNPAARGEVHHGERLDPAGYGPGVIETMEEALVREAEVLAPQEANPKARNGAQGTWIVPSERATYYPHSGLRNAINKWGDTRMGIGFPDVVDVHEAYFAGQAGAGVWANGILVIGYRSGEEVGRTEWLRKIGTEPQRLAINLRGVDRMVIVSQPVYNGGGWYAIDDLAFSIHDPYANEPQLRRVIDFEDVAPHTKLTGSGYAGLVWETGTGDFEAGNAMPAPQVPPDAQVPDPGFHPQPEGGSPSGGTLPDLELSFQAAIRGQSGSWSYPPDTDGAIGPNHFVETVNRVFAVYDKETGEELLSMTLGAFLPGSNGDPRVEFDQHSGRWIVLVTDFSSRFYLAVSITDDPLGSWFKTDFLVSEGDDANSWPDYPTLGVDANGIYSGAYMVGGGQRMTIFAIDKAPLVAPTPSLGTVTAFRLLPWEGAIQPVHVYGDQPAGEYLVTRRWPGLIRVRRLDPPLTNPTLLELGDVEILPYQSPPDAPALGSITPLDTVGTRLMMAAYLNGSIWTAHTVKVDDRAACRWYQLDPESLELIQSGTVADSELYYYFPSIAANRFGDAVMAFTGSSANQYAAAYYTGRRAGDPLGEMAPPAMLHAGSGAQNNIDGLGRNRWGDYSHTTLDPIDQHRIWTIQEYGHATNIWGTWVGMMNLGDCNSNGVRDECDMDCGEPGGDCDVPGCGMVGDCNANGAPDDCDILRGISLDLNHDGRPDECPIPGDFDGDHDVDLFDYAGMVECFSGPGADELPEPCEPLDFDGDGDVDLIDFWAYQAAFTGDCGVRITQHPADVAECPQGTAVFEVTAEADQLSYHWYHNGAEIAGATDPTLVITPATDESAGVYVVYVVSGCGVAPSDQATLAIHPPPVIVSPPQDFAACLGGPATFTVEPAGFEPFTYRWQFNGQTIAGATDATLVIDPVGTEDTGSYRCAVTDGCEQSTTSPSATLSLTPVVNFNLHPAGNTFCVGDTILLTASATGMPTYTWFKDGEAVPNVSTPFLPIPFADTDDSGTYYVVAVNACYSDTSDEAVVQVIQCADSP